MFSITLPSENIAHLRFEDDDVVVDFERNFDMDLEDLINEFSGAIKEIHRINPDDFEMPEWRWGFG